MSDRDLAIVAVSVAALVLLIVVLPPWRSVRRERRLPADETTRALSGDDTDE